MTKAGRIAAASIAAIPIGIAIELGLEVSTSLDRYNATLSQAIDAARHSVFMPYGVKDWIVWAALVLIAFVVREAFTARHDQTSVKHRGGRTDRVRQRPGCNAKSND